MPRTACSEASPCPPQLALLHYITSNSRLFKGKPLGCLAFPVELAPALEQIISGYPQPIKLADIEVPFPLDMARFGGGCLCTWK